MHEVVAAALEEPARRRRAPSPAGRRTGRRPRRRRPCRAGAAACRPGCRPGCARLLDRCAAACRGRGTSGQGSLDDDAVAAAARARLGEGEEALVARAHAAPVALGAHRRAGARRRARAAAVAQRPASRPGSSAARPYRLVEREVDRPPGRRRGGPPARSPPAPAAGRGRRSPSSVGDVEARRCRVPRNRAGRSRWARAARGAELVVRLALLGVGQRVVGRRDLLEPLLGLRVARVRVGVVLPGELAVRLLDLVGARGRVTPSTS